jgi:hypothetical protein
MTPKDKAKELVDKYYNFGDQEFDYSKEFALIAVDELLNNFLSNRTTMIILLSITILLAPAIVWGWVCTIALTYNYLKK